LDRYVTDDGIVVHEYSKPRYNLYNMYATVPDGTPELVILQAWYDGKFGEATCVNKLLALGLIGFDRFKESEFQPTKLRDSIMKGNEPWQKR